MPTDAELRAIEQAQDDVIVKCKLAEAIYLSLTAVICEPIPKNMKILLLRLAFVETVIRENDIEARETKCGILMHNRQTELATATCHVAQAEKIVAHQHEHVAQLQAENRPTDDAVKLLDTFIQTLATLEYHQRLLRDEVEGKHRKPEWIFARLAAAAV